MPRTTIHIDSAVLETLRKRARESGRTIGDVASELLALALIEDRRPAPRLVWRSKDMKARIDIEDKEALYRVLDGR